MATREGLYEALDRFRDALAARDAARLEWSPALRYTENNVALEPGDGLWNTLTALGPYDLRFADASHGQAALFTCVAETDAVSPCAIRLGFRDGVVEEAEIVVARNKDEGFAFHGQRFDDKPAMLADVPEAERVSRAEMIALANGFIDHSGRLGEYQLTDGTKVTSPIRRPHSYYLAEAFKIRDGAIEQVEAVFHTVPYKMPSPWDFAS